MEEVGWGAVGMYGSFFWVLGGVRVWGVGDRGRMGGGGREETGRGHRIEG